MTNSISLNQQQREWYDWNGLDWNGLIKLRSTESSRRFFSSANRPLHAEGLVESWALFVADTCNASCSFVEVWLDASISSIGWDRVAIDVFRRSRIASVKLLSIRRELEWGRGERGERERRDRKSDGRESEGKERMRGEKEWEERKSERRERVRGEKESEERKSEGGGVRVELGRRSGLEKSETD